MYNVFSEVVPPIEKVVMCRAIFAFQKVEVVLYLVVRNGNDKAGKTTKDLAIVRT